MSDTQATPPDADDLTTLQAQLSATQQELASTRQQLEVTERRQRIDGLLVDADAIDLEAARLLTEAAVQLMDEPDVKLAVDELRRRKPYLFRRRVSVAGGAMTARVRHATTHADDAAEQAATTGNRRDLLHYLRMRRKR